MLRCLMAWCLVTVSSGYTLNSKEKGSRVHLYISSVAQVVSRRIPKCCTSEFTLKLDRVTDLLQTVAVCDM